MYALQNTNNITVKIIDILLAMWTAQMIGSDYGYKGILLILIYHLAKNCQAVKLILGTSWNFLWNASIQGYGALASIPIMMYNGKKGRNMKYLFYVFYPVHLLILFFVSYILN